MHRVVLLINGSLRTGSVNAAVLKTAQQVVPAGIEARLYAALAQLPHFNPDDDREPLHPMVVGLREAIRDADAILFCTPEYAGALPGALKNLLDWTVGGIEMNAKPVGWINAASSAAPAGGEDAYASLRKVLGYVSASIVEGACVRVPMARQDVDSDGIIRDETTRVRIAACLSALVGAATR